MDDIFTLLLRGAAALVWIVALAQVIRQRSTLNGSFTRRLLSTGTVAVVLTAVALGPVLAPIVGPAVVRTLYTATAVGAAIAGIAIALDRSH